MNKTLECPYCDAKEETQFELIGGADDPQGKPAPYAYMVYRCECDAICKKNIWGDPSEIWISATNQYVNFNAEKIRGCASPVNQSD